MRVLVAGATGVIGRALLPALNQSGHNVIGMIRSPHAADLVRQADAEPVHADALDAESVTRAVTETAPDAIINMLTAIPATIRPRKLATQFALTNRLRTEGTRNLIHAAQHIGGARIISQGLAYGYQPAPGHADEEAALWTSNPPRQFAPVITALGELEDATTAAEGLVLRFGHLYGPATIYAPDGSFASQVRDGKVPLVGGGHAVFSFTHVEDAANAVVAALDRPDLTGALNIVDNTPTPLHQWLPRYADLLRAPAPETAPAWLATLLVGRWGVAFMNHLRGADNTRAIHLLQWKPRYGSYTDGFAADNTSN